MSRILLQVGVLFFALLTLGGCASSIHASVKAGDIYAVKRAIDDGASVGINFMSGSPLNPAIKNNDLEMIKLLHESGAQILPAHLSVAAQASAYSTYDYLHRSGADLAGCYLDQNYPGWWAGSNSVGSIVPPIASAIMRKDIVSVRRLLDLGATQEGPCEVPSGLGGDYNYSAILFAGVSGDPEIIDLLVGRGAEVNTLNVHGQTALSLASERGHYDAVRVLLAHGAFHTYAGEIRQPIEFALDGGHEDVVALLKYAGAVRPKRKNNSSVSRNIGEAALEGIKFAAYMYVIYLGARYSNYDQSYTQAAFDLYGYKEKGGSSAGSDRDSCSSDYDCGLNKICAKDVGERIGSCVRDATDSGRLRSSRGVGPSNRGPGPYNPEVCPFGYKKDLIYGGCRR